MSDIATFKIKYTIEQMDELKQLVSDVNDTNLYGLSKLEERIDALERRIEKLEADMFAQHAIAMNHSDSIDRIERKLNHKGGNE